MDGRDKHGHDGKRLPQALQRHGDGADQPVWVEDPQKFAPQLVLDSLLDQGGAKSAAGGSSIRGPSVSFHSIVSVACASAMSLHAIRTRPSGRDNAPYLTALVRSSLKTMARPTVARGLICWRHISSSIRSGEVDRYGSHMLWTSS